MAVHAKSLLLLGAFFLAGCASSTYTSTWKSPDVTPLGFRGEKVVAAAIVKDEKQRRLAEDRLAQQIAVRGAQGRTMYSLLPQVTTNEQAVRAALEGIKAKGLIVLEPIYIDRNVTITPAYEGGGEASVWGGTGGGGFAISYSSPREAQISEKTVVYIVTRVYSLVQKKIVWCGG